MVYNIHCNVLTIPTLSTTADLNPASFKYLEMNAHNNHCAPGRRLHCYNMCGRCADIRIHNILYSIYTIHYTISYYPLTTSYTTLH